MILETTNPIPSFPETSNSGQFMPIASLETKRLWIVILSWIYFQIVKQEAKQNWHILSSRLTAPTTTSSCKDKWLQCFTKSTESIRNKFSSSLYWWWLIFGSYLFSPWYVSVSVLAYTFGFSFFFLSFPKISSSMCYHPSHIVRI